MLISFSKLVMQYNLLLHTHIIFSFLSISLLYRSVIDFLVMSFLPSSSKAKLLLLMPNFLFIIFILSYPYFINDYLLVIFYHLLQYLILNVYIVVQVSLRILCH